MRWVAWRLKRPRLRDDAPGAAPACARRRRRALRGRCGAGQRAAGAQSVRPRGFGLWKAAVSSGARKGRTRGRGAAGAGSPPRRPREARTASRAATRRPRAAADGATRPQRCRAAAQRRQHRRRRRAQLLLLRRQRQRMKPCRAQQPQQAHLQHRLVAATLRRRSHAASRRQTALTSCAREARSG